MAEGLEWFATSTSGTPGLLEAVPALESNTGQPRGAQDPLCVRHQPRSEGVVSTTDGRAKSSTRPQPGGSVPPSPDRLVDALCSDEGAVVVLASGAEGADRSLQKRQPRQPGKAVHSAVDPARGGQSLLAAHDP
jgi:hypothetical protein